MRSIGIFSIQSNHGRHQGISLSLSPVHPNNPIEAFQAFTQTVIDYRNDPDLMVVKLLEVKSENTGKRFFTLGRPLGGVDGIVELRAYLQYPLFTSDIDKDKVDFLFLSFLGNLNAGDGNGIDLTRVERYLTKTAKNHVEDEFLIKKLDPFSVTSNGTALINRNAQKSFKVSAEITVHPTQMQIEDHWVDFTSSRVTVSFDPRDWYEDNWAGNEHPFEDKGIVTSINEHLKTLGYGGEVAWGEGDEQKFGRMSFIPSWELLKSVFPEHAQKLKTLQVADV